MGGRQRRLFVPELVQFLIVVRRVGAWMAVLICTGGDRVPFDLPNNPPTVVFLVL
jgi:hypothetical protein